MWTLRIVFMGDPHVALLDLLDQGLGIEFPETWGNLEQLRGLWLVPNVLGGNHRTVLGLDPQRKFSHRVDPAEELSTGS